MNKDLDERLVPNGEYRDALNIEISTSEDSNTGAVQNIKGNVKVTDLDHVGNAFMTSSFSSNATTVGSYSDEATKNVFNFIHLASDFEDEVVGGYTVKTGVKSDVITTFEPDFSSETGVTFPLVVDVYEVRHKSKGDQANLGILKSGDFDTIVVGTFNGQDLYGPKGIRVGMRVEIYNPATGNSAYGAGDRVTVTNIHYDTVANNVTVSTTVPISGTLWNINTHTNLGYVWRYTADRILNFLPGSVEVESNTTGTPSSQTPINNIITGISFVDGILFYTDNRNEPKKIYLKDFKKSNLFRNIQNHSVVSTASGGRHLEEEHITTIKKSPRLAPKISSTIFSNRGNVVSTVSDSNGSDFSLHDGGVALDNAAVIDNGLNVIQITTGTPVDWQVGDLVELIGSISGATAIVEIIPSIVSNYDPSIPGGTSFEIEVLSVSSNYVIDPSSPPQDEEWVGYASADKNIDEDAFYFFSYRYKFKNGERSVLAPYSQAVFLPKVFQFNPETGVNEGMVNSINEITVYDFVEHGIPNDVKAIELVFKSSNSENPIIFRNIERTDVEFSQQFLGGKNKGVVVVSESIFGTTLPTKQQLRTFDGVPRKALAQDISASRVLYGNYVEGYDLLDQGGVPISIVTQNTHISTGLSAAPAFNTSAVGDTSITIDSGEPDSTWVINYTANAGIGWDTPYTRAGNETTSNGDFLILNYLSNSACPVLQSFNINSPASTVSFNNTLFYRQSFEQADIIDGVGGWDFNQQSFVVPTLSNPGQTKSYNISYSVDPLIFLSYYDNSGNQVDSQGFTLNSLKIKLIHETAGGVQNELASYNDSAVNNNNENSHSISTQVPHQDNMLQVAACVLEAFNVQASSADKFYVIIHLDCKITDQNQDIDEVYITGFNPHYSGNAGSPTIQITDLTPSLANPNLEISNPSKSVKSDQKYQLGVVYGDYYGRETPVLVDENNSVLIPKSKSSTVNTLVASINSNAPSWADYYKIYVKEIAPEFYNITLCSAYPVDLDPTLVTVGNNPTSTQTSFVEATDYGWLSFNSVDRSKIEKNDFLVLKKEHGNNQAVSDDDAKFRVLDIVDNAAEGFDSTGTSTGFSINGVDLLNADFEDVNGKFFVKIKVTPSFLSFIGNVINPGADTLSQQAAVFEVRKQKIIDLDLFYEASQAYPITISDDVCYQYVNFGDVVNLLSPFNASLGSQTCDDFNSLNLSVANVRGARATGFDNINQNWSANGSLEGLVEIELSSIPAGFNSGQLANSIVSFLRPIKGFTSLEIVYNDGLMLYCRALSHATSFTPSIPIGLTWWNAISFRNGVESDRILDDFNTDTVYRYTNVGKVSGFESSIQDLDYKETRVSNSIIFSNLYNSKTGTGFNEFLLADDIVKKVNSEYGSIQKLYARMGDVVTFCENKVLRILSSGKDAIFNADGKQQLIASKNVLGQAVPYLGEYGISTNPESFAAEEYRLYFADKNRGSICRLSRDGITPISEAGMKDWFNDHLKDARAIIGSYDGKKNEYNVVIHELTNPGSSKNVYNLGYKENVKGWTSFKSFIYESGVTLSNKYYTFKNGLSFLHHPDVLTQTHCNFYGTDNNSSITDIFNEVSSAVKLFKAVNYEGTQSKVVKFTDEVVGGVTYNDNEYYNEIAKNGWHVESIVTDMQEGDVDEFIEKEGKWYNYIKGIDTTFTNSNGTPTGNADGNLDFNEFSVQGIANLSADATLAPGSDPLPAPSGSTNNGGPSSQGFGYSLFVNNADNDPSYTPTASHHANQTVVPTPVTTFMLPEPGYGIAAADFNAIISSIVFPSNVLSVSFADSTTPYAANNEVIATFILDGSVALTQYTFDTVNISGVSGVLLPIQYSANINITSTAPNGMFGGSNPMTVSYNIDPNNGGVVNGLLTLVNSTPNQLEYLFTASIPAAFDDDLINFQFDAGAHIFDTGIPITISLVNGEVQNYTLTSNVSDPISASAGVAYDYQIISGSNFPVDDNNDITIVLPTSPAVLEYANYNNGVFTPLGTAVNVSPVGNTSTFGVNSNSGTFTASILNNNFSPATDIQVTQVIHDPLNQGGSLVMVTFQNNNSTSARSCDIKITSDADPNLTDTITLTQNVGAQITAVADWFLFMPDANNNYVQTWYADPTYQGNSSQFYVNDLTGNLYSLPGPGIDNTTGGARIFVDYNNAFGIPTPFDSTHFTVVDTATNTTPTWITINGVSYDSTNISAVIDFSVDVNSSGASRTAEFSIQHPDDPTVLSANDPVTVTQPTMYVASANTLVFHEEDANSATNGIYPDAGTDIVFDHTAGPKVFWIKIPNTDAETSNGIGYHGTQQNGVYNNVGKEFVYPQWYENIQFSSTVGTIQPGGSNGWNQTTPTIEREVPYYTQFNPPPPQSVFTNDVNYKVTVDMTHNYAVGGVGGWQASFPVDREFTLHGFNPHNPNYPGNLNGSPTFFGGPPTALAQQPDDTVVIKQTAEPRAFWYASNQLILPSVQTTFNSMNLMPTIRANGSTPTVIASFFTDNSAAQSQTGAINASWLTNINLNNFGATTGPLANVQYNFSTSGSNSFVLEPNFTLSDRYIGLSVFHSDHPSPVAGDAIPGNTGNSDYIVMTQPSETPYVLWDDAVIAANTIHENVVPDNSQEIFDPNGNQIVDHVGFNIDPQNWVTIGGPSSGPFIVEIPINYGPASSAPAVIEFLSANEDISTPTLTFSHPSFFTTADLAGCSVSNGMLTVQISSLPSTAFFGLNLKVVHGNNPNVFAIIELLIA
tara:strand:- start:5444 stop:13675 length:8232 start_codon:yes stop_codon:yes gene_type:complete